MDGHAEGNDHAPSATIVDNSLMSPDKDPNHETILDQSSVRTAPIQIDAATPPVTSTHSLPVDRFANLAVQDTRRRGLYGAEAFHREAQIWTSSRNMHPQIMSDHTGTSPDQSSRSVDLSRPSKISRTDTRTRPGLLAPQATFEGNANMATERLNSLDANCPSSSDISFGSISKARQHLSPGDSAISSRPPALADQRNTLTTASGENIMGFAEDEHGNSYGCQPPVSLISASAMSVGLPNDPDRSHLLEPGTSNKKRKRIAMVNDILPPPPFIWQGTTDPDFTAFQGLLLFPELCFTLVAHLPLRDLISLYSISREFHAIIDSRFTTTCLTIAYKKAPESARVFHFRMYSHLCRPDPANRIPHPDPVKAAASQPRMVPSFRWVAFVLFREKVVHELMAIFAENGIPLPYRCQIALKKMWLIMDIPDNARRIGLIHNRNIISDLNLYLMFCFFVKLDMICHDPLAAEKHDGLRKLMLSQRDGLLSVLLVLKRVKWTHQADLLVAWVRHACEIPAAQDTEDFDAVAFGAESIFGVPIKEAGLGKYEYWGRKGAIRRVLPGSNQKQRYGMLMRPDQLVMREAVRRRLEFTKIAMRAVLCCYVDQKTLKSFPPGPFPRRIPEWNDEEYGADDLVGGASAVALEHGGDPLLDLGEASRGAPLVVSRDPGKDVMGTCAREVREDEETFLDLCVQYCGIEVSKIGQDDPVTREELRLLP